MWEALKKNKVQNLETDSQALALPALQRWSNLLIADRSLDSPVSNLEIPARLYPHLCGERLGAKLLSLNWLGRCQDREEFFDGLVVWAF